MAARQSDMTLVFACPIRRFDAWGMLKYQIALKIGKGKFDALNFDTLEFGTLKLDTWKFETTCLEVWCNMT